MTVKIYRDDAANAIFVEDNNGAQFLNNLQAVTDSPSDTVFRIRDKSRDNLLLSNLSASDVVDQNGDVYGADVQSAVNALNALFSASGTPDGVAPVITIAAVVARAVWETVMTSSPGPMPRALRARTSASVPLPTPTQWERS